MLKVGILQCYLEIPWAQTLKDKRSVLNSIRDRTRRRFNVSIAEFDHTEIPNATSIGIVMAGSDTQYILGALDKFRETLRDWPEAQLVDSQVEVI